MDLNIKVIQKTIKKSQHCQRNWDVSSKISDEHLATMVTAVTECPSKQNIAFYRANFVTNRELIEAIHEATNGFVVDYEPLKITTNSQVLANLLVVFEAIDLKEISFEDPNRNTQTRDLHSAKPTHSSSNETICSDQLLAIGVASGYLNLTANLLGYSTGCCSCFDALQIKGILNLKYFPTLLMGVGVPNPNLSRRVHHAKHDFLFPTKPKQKIDVDFFK